jgi:hypothetical protein
VTFQEGSEEVSVQSLNAWTSRVVWAFALKLGGAATPESADSTCGLVLHIGRIEPHELVRGSAVNVLSVIYLQKTKGQGWSCRCLLCLSWEAGAGAQIKQGLPLKQRAHPPSAFAEATEILPTSFGALITLSRQSLYLYEFVLKNPQTIHPGTSPTALA